MLAANPIDSIDQAFRPVVATKPISGDRGGSRDTVPVRLYPALDFMRSNRIGAARDSELLDQVFSQRVPAPPLGGIEPARRNERRTRWQKKVPL